MANQRVAQTVDVGASAERNVFVPNWSFTGSFLLDYESSPWTFLAPARIFGFHARLTVVGTTPTEVTINKNGSPLLDVGRPPSQGSPLITILAGAHVGGHFDATHPGINPLPPVAGVWDFVAGDYLTMTLTGVGTDAAGLTVIPITVQKLG